MSKPELDIIRSQSAEAFLRTVTKGFYDRSYIALWLYEVIGREWDELREWSEGMRDEIHPQTCTWSIPIWEWVYGFEPDESLTLEERRRRVLSKVFGTRPINPEAIRRGIEALSGIDTKVTDFASPYAFSITLYPDIEAMPDKEIPDGRIVQYVQEVKPAHLRVDMGVEVRREFRYTIPIARSGTIGTFYKYLPIGEDRAARAGFFVGHAGLHQQAVSASPVSKGKAFHKPVSVSHSGLLPPTLTGALPDTHTASVGHRSGRGGAYMHSHIKPKRID